jgi:thioredoxin-related protein
MERFGGILFERAALRLDRLRATARAGRILGFGMILSAVFPAGAAELLLRTDLLPQPELGADGLWVQDWYQPTTGDLREDLAAAAREGKILALFWEAAGCQYCAQMHMTALRMPEVRDYITDRFYAVRLDRFGSLPIIDFDGHTQSERSIAALHRVQGTPAVEFRLADGTEVFRLPGFAEPVIFQAIFEYVHTGGYLSDPVLDWLRSREFLDPA